MIEHTHVATTERASQGRATTSNAGTQAADPSVPAATSGEAEATMAPVVSSPVPPNGDAFWRTCAEQLRGELTPQQYAAWIKPLTSVSFEPVARRLRVGAPNRFKHLAVRDAY